MDTPTSCHRFAAKCKRCVKDLFDGQRGEIEFHRRSSMANFDGKSGEMFILTLDQLADRERIERSQLDA